MKEEEYPPKHIPLKDAAEIRTGVAHALHSEAWYNETVSPEVAACLIGVDAQILKNPHVSLLFHQTEDGFEIAGRNHKGNCIKGVPIMEIIT